MLLFSLFVHACLCVRASHAILLFLFSITSSSTSSSGGGSSGSSIVSSIETTAQQAADSVNEYGIPSGARVSWAMDYTELVGRWAMTVTGGLEEAGGGGDNGRTAAALLSPADLSLSFILSCLNMDSVIKNKVAENPGPDTMRIN